MTRLSKSQIDKLGDRLRKAGLPAEQDIRDLNEVLESHREALAAAASIVHREVPAFRVIAARLKSARSTIDKLKRSDSMQLSRMQDLAGIRVVVEGGRQIQDDVVQRLANALSKTRIIDRRQNPQQGYRAVHVVGLVAERWVEVQVRTARQHDWAELFEKLADVWGRQIRYGGQPTPLPAAGRVDPAATLEIMAKLADFIASVEQLERVRNPSAPEILAELEKLINLLRRSIVL